MLQSIVFHGLVVEPRAITRFPFRTADHAELGATATGHMVAAFLELDHGRAVEAPLPPFFLRDLGKPLRGFIFWTFAARVPLAVAGAAHLRSAPVAFTVFPAGIGTATGVHMDLGGLDPLAAAFGRAVNPVFRRILLIFLVPFHFETRVEEFLDMFQRNVILGAALGRHMLWIIDRHGKDSTQT